jgi:hypothetical protein
MTSFETANGKNQTTSKTNSLRKKMCSDVSSGTGRTPFQGNRAVIYIIVTLIARNDGNIPKFKWKLMVRLEQGQVKQATN